MKTVILTLLVGLISVIPPSLASITSKDLTLVPHNPLPEVELTLNIHVREEGARQGAYSDEPDTDLAVKIKDFVTFSFSASKDGYVSLWNVGTSKRVIRLFPNRNQQDMKVVAGKSYQLGRKDQPTGFRVEGPEGMEDVFLLWTAKESDQPAQYGGTELNSRGVYDVKELLQLAELKEDSWASQPLTYDVSESGAPNTRDYDAVLQKAAKNLSMGGVQGNVYLLAMGANTGKLSKAGTDAINFRNAIKKLFGKKVRNKTYSDARVQDFRSGMKWLKKNAGKNDLAIIYYSGHGSTLPDQNGDEKDKLDEVFVMTDANKTKAPGLKHVIVDDEFADMVSALQTENLIVVIDACYAGGLTKNLRLSKVREKFFVGGQLGKATSRLSKMSDQLVDWFSGGADFKKGVLVYAAPENLSAYEDAEGGVMTNQLLDEMLSKRNTGQNWLSLIKKAGLQTRKKVGVQPAVKGNVRLLQQIRLSN